MLAIFYNTYYRVGDEMILFLILYAAAILTATLLALELKEWSKKR